MGEATYYIKAEFSHQEKAQRALKLMRKLIKQGIDSADYWQSNRDARKEEFWTEFKAKFPVVYRFLKAWDVERKAKWEKNVAEKGRENVYPHEYEPSADGDNNNGLAGKLDFGSVEDVENLRLDGNVLKYSSCVWHCASWDGFVKYLLDACGADAAGWLSDEYVDKDYFSMIKTANKTEV